MPAKALECAVAYYGDIVPVHFNWRTLMNYCKILNYLAHCWTNAFHTADEWDNIERLHDALNDAEINELNLIYSGE